MTNKELFFQILSDKLKANMTKNPQHFIYDYDKTFSNMQERITKGKACVQLVSVKETCADLGLRNTAKQILDFIDE